MERHELVTTEEERPRVNIKISIPKVGRSFDLTVTSGIVVTASKQAATGFAPIIFGTDVETVGAWASLTIAMHEAGLGERLQDFLAHFRKENGVDFLEMLSSDAAR